jgi:hypothetical protein
VPVAMLLIFFIAVSLKANLSRYNFYKYKTLF